MIFYAFSLDYFRETLVMHHWKLLDLEIAHVLENLFFFLFRSG